MAVTHRRVRIGALAAVVLSLVCALPASASAVTLAPAAPSQYNTTPDCPVSASDIVCAWNVPVDAGNVFGTGDYGQCPYWAAEKYPALVLDEVLTDPLGEDWDGGTWLEHATEEGLGATTTPASGDLAVWQAEGGDYTGHIAYVEAVVGDAIIVSQMDGASSAPFPADQGSTEWISAANLSYFESAFNLQFISTGSASSTPLADVEQTPAANDPRTTTTSTLTPTTTVKQPTVKRRTSAKQTTLKAAKTKRKATKTKRKAAKQKAAKRTTVKRTTVKRTTGDRRHSAV